MSPEIIKKVVEAALMASGQPLNVDKLLSLFAEGDTKPERSAIKDALKEIDADCHDRGIELREVASGWRYQVKEDFAPWVARLWDERPQRYTRALLETLALIAYKQPITRGEIEDVRGVSVSSSIIKTLTERDWIKVVGHRDVPGKPAMYGTTKQFLDYFNLKSLDDMPSLAELRDYDKLNEELDLKLPDEFIEGLKQEEAEVENDGDVAEAAEPEVVDDDESDDVKDAEDDFDEEDIEAVDEDMSEEESVPQDKAS